eukprot:5578062-Lingulodinium_polyedra.AAC.1
MRARKARTRLAAVRNISSFSRIVHACACRKGLSHPLASGSLRPPPGRAGSFPSPSLPPPSA